MRWLAVSLLCASSALASDFSAEELRGLTENRAFLKGSVTVVVFLSARCPISNAYGDRLQQAYNNYRGQGVRFLFVDSNVNEEEAEIR